MEEFGLRMRTEAAQGCYCTKHSARSLVFSGPNLVQTEPKATPCVDVRGGSPESRRRLGLGAGGGAQDLLRVCSAPPGWAGAVPPQTSWHGIEGPWCRSTAPAGLRGSELRSRSSANSGGQHFASWKPRERSVFFRRAAAQKQPVMESSASWVFPLPPPLRRQSLGRWWWRFAALLLGFALGAGCTNPDSVSCL